MEMDTAKTLAQRYLDETLPAPAFFKNMKIVDVRLHRRKTKGRKVREWFVYLCPYLPDEGVFDSPPVLVVNGY